MLKKLLLAFLSLNLLFATVFTPVAKAQFDVGTGGTWYSPSWEEFSTRVFDEDNPEEIFGERYTYAQVVWIFYSLSSILIPDFVQQCASDTDQSPQQLAECLSSVIGTFFAHENTQSEASLAGTINSTFFANPLSGIGYIRSSLSKAHIVPEAKAQGAGFGYENLEPVRAIWAGIRNVSYFLMILAFVVMAFLIMFRTKTSPQTVITVQSALPKLILILILITFSYAISGFVIDLAYLFLGLTAIAFSSSGISNLGPLHLFQAMLGSHPMISLFLSLISYFVISLFNGVGIVGSVLLGPIISILQVLFILILLIIFVLVWVKLLWVLFKAFINIILLVLAAPIMLLLGVFPAGGGFGNWLRNLASHVAIFPAVQVMLLLAHFMFWANLEEGSLINETLSLIPLLNPFGIDPAGGSTIIQLPGFALGSPEVFAFVVSLGILFLAPSVGNIIQSFISGKPFSYGSAIAAPIAAGAGIATFIPREAYDTHRQSIYKGVVGRVRERITGTERSDDATRER